VTAAPADERARLDAAVKSDDAFFTTYFVSPYSKYLARWAAHRGLSPNAVSCTSMAVGLAAAACFAVGTRPWLVAGAVLVQVSFTLDCVDGQLARFTGRSSRFGGWLDAVFDRSKEYVVYAGLALGSVRGFHEDVWALAGAALVLQTGRHLVDFSYAARETAHRQPVPARRLGEGALRLSAVTDRSDWTRWPKRILVLPIGERFLLLSVTAALFRPEVTFLALLVWGSVAGAYALAGRLLRSLA
jgi:phosphatidylglycerophosphate synthase